MQISHFWRGNRRIAFLLLAAGQPLTAAAQHNNQLEELKKENERLVFPLTRAAVTSE